MSERPWLKSIRIQGFRPFRDFQADLGPLEVLVGANGSGKSSLIEFLEFLRDALYDDIPPEVLPGWIGQQVFHVPGPDRFGWSVQVALSEHAAVCYEGQVVGPVGRPVVPAESAQLIAPNGETSAEGALLKAEERQAWIKAGPGASWKQEPDLLKRPNQLALAAVTSPSFRDLYGLREYIRGWRFYNPFEIDLDRIGAGVPTEQEPGLREDASNLSSVLHFLYTEHRDRFNDLQRVLRSVVPGFGELSVKARGGPGQIIAFWAEEGLGQELTLADLSDGTLQLLCWSVLCLHPKPPSLICLDEPDLGLHPRALPVLAGLLEEASERTQILVATHSSYFLTQFDLSRIAVLRKENGEARFLKPQESKVLTAILEDFGPDEIEVMHRSDELERLP